MSRRPFPIILVLLSLLLMVLLAACTGINQASETPLPEGTVDIESLLTPPQSGVDQAPYTINLVSAATPAIDPACLNSTGEFKLNAAALPVGGLEPGITQIFCAVDAPADAVVTFTLKGPEGERSYEVASQAQEGANVALLPLRLTADDSAGTYTLTAATGDLKSDLGFSVRPASAPFITLAEEPGDNPQFIRAMIGGLEPGSTARFALYKLSNAQTGAANGNFLISTRVAADASGRADLELDVADLPSGPYLLLLIPGAVEELGDPATVSLPEQERQLIVVNIMRDGQIAQPGTGEQPALPPTDILAAPQPAGTAGPLPETISAVLPAAELPICAPASAPAVQIWPTQGEIGDWWYGCASGFAPDENITFVVKLPGGQQAQFALPADASGVTDFRWYSVPGEGAGDYSVTASGANGKASQDWMISTPARPQALVFPHDYQSDVGGEINLAGFPANATVDLALYRLDEQGNGTATKRWQVETNRFGAFKDKFEQAVGLEPGQYAVVAAGGPAFAFPGINTTASAIDFFAVDATPDTRYENYTLNSGRQAQAVAEATPTPLPVEVEEPTPTPAEIVEATPVVTATLAVEATPTVTETVVVEATPAATVAPVVSIPPTTISLPEDTSPPPTCPDAQAGQPAICLIPSTIQRGTYAYLIMHDFAPGTRFNINVTTPNGDRVPLSVQADANGFADAHWYALNDEALGTYRVRVQGGGQTFNGNFEVVQPTTPSVVVQSRNNEPGVPVIASVAGFAANEPLILARYRRTGSENGAASFDLVDTFNVKAGGIGGAQRQLDTRDAQNGDLFLVAVFRPGQTEAQPVAQAVYTIGEELQGRYPYGWGQNLQEGQ